MKIAILILIHEFTEQQQKMIKYLSQDFDIFIHIDKRSDIKPEVIEGISNNIFVYKKYKVYWGHYNQILATLFLFKIANVNKIYNRFIFISGSDLPIKTNQQIKKFFENNNKEYLEFEEFPRKCWESGGFDRIDYFHVKSLSRGRTNRLVVLFTKVLNKINTRIFIPVLKRLGLHRKRLGIKFYGGANWMDLTDNCVAQIIQYTDDNPSYIRRFKYTRCADEIFFQTIICNYVKNVDLENKCLRFIDWESGPEYPRVLRIEDFERIKESECMFSRKFNMLKEPEIINKIFDEILMA